MTAHRRSTAALTVLAAAVLLVPLALLTYFSLQFATDAVEGEVESRLESTASLAATAVAEELRGLTLLVESYAGRPTLVSAITAPRLDRGALRFHLRELTRARRGVELVFVARLDAHLVDIVPATPSIVGDDFSFRDWYRGLRATGRTYVSEAYVTQATGNERVVGAATYIRSGGRPVAILVAGYTLDHIQGFSDSIAMSQGVGLWVTDQRGVLVAKPGGLPPGLAGRRHDPRVAEALAGRSGIQELDTSEGRRLSAHTPVPPFGWTITASVPSDTAFAAVTKLRRTVLSIAGVLALLLLAGLALLAVSLRQRARAEAEARRQARINDAVLEATTDGIALVDASGRIVLANGTFDRFVGDIVGRPLDATRESLPAISEEVARNTANPAAYRASTAEIARDPEHVGVDEFRIVESGRAFLRYIAPVRNTVGEQLGRLVVLREVTAEREAEQMKSDLLATVSHELRTPLTGILGFAELLVRHDPDPDTRALYLGTIHAEAKRLTSLINDFLDLQRIESGAFALSLEPFDLKQVLEHQVTLFSGQSSTHRIELNVPDEQLIVVGEPERLAQVVANLLSNAIKYSPDGGVVEATADARDGFVRVAVRDRGLGIPADQQASVFEKFFRVDTSDTRKIGGTGLGLAVAREIVEAHAGVMGFDSVYGEGSTFWFDLPFGRQPSGTTLGRILVVEDEPATAAALAAHLTADGFSVDVVANGADAITRAQEDPPTAICLDIRLEGDVDGWDVLGALKAHPTTNRVPVVVCTGGNGRGRAAALGAADFLTKPFSGEQLVEAIVRLLPEKRGDVLVVEDDERLRRFVSATLSQNGFRPRDAVDGVDALEQISSGRPDAIVLDLMMPRLDGFSVLERLQREPETRAIPVVVLTARRLSAEERRTLSTQTVALLDKAVYSPQELLQLVKQAVGDPPD